MKKILFSLCLSALSPVIAQAQAGPIAHWTMNANVSDITGNGHDGTIHGNVVPATGKDGRANTAYYFAGDANSYLTAPYMPDLDLTEYSICATVKIAGFYHGTCQANALFYRGGQYVAGNYSLLFYDNAYDQDCNAVDTTKNVFTAIAGTNPSNDLARNYSSYIQPGTWYSVVATYGASQIKIYVDGMLKIVIPAPAAVGTSRDGISIGGNRFGNYMQYPYSFKGYIDDMKLYDRVLSVSEITAYNNATLAVEDIKAVPTFTAISNPAYGRISIKLSWRGKGSLTVTNITGQIVSRQAIDPNSGIVTTDNLSPGIYYVTLQAGADRTTQKIVVQ